MFRISPIYHSTLESIFEPALKLMFCHLSIALLIYKNICIVYDIIFIRITLLIKLGLQIGLILTLIVL